MALDGKRGGFLSLGCHWTCLFFPFVLTCGFNRTSPDKTFLIVSIPLKLSRRKSTTAIVDKLGWRTDARLCLFLKLVGLHGLVAVPFSDYIEPSTQIA